MEAPLYPWPYEYGWVSRLAANTGEVSWRGALRPATRRSCGQYAGNIRETIRPIITLDAMSNGEATCSGFVAVPLERAHIALKIVWYSLAA